jgi:hypothetical protein
MRRTSRQKSPLNPIEQPRIRQLRRSQTEKFPQFPPVSKEAWQFSPIIGSAATTRAAARDTAGLGGYPAGDGWALGPPRFDQRSSTCFASLHKLHRRGHRAGREHHGHPSALLQRGTALRSSTFDSARVRQRNGRAGIDETRPQLTTGRSAASSSAVGSESAFPCSHASPRITLTRTPTGRSKASKPRSARFSWSTAFRTR